MRHTHPCEPDQPDQPTRLTHDAFNRLTQNLPAAGDGWLRGAFEDLIIVLSNPFASALLRLKLKKLLKPSDHNSGIKAARNQDQTESQAHQSEVEAAQNQDQIGSQTHQRGVEAAQNQDQMGPQTHQSGVEAARDRAHTGPHTRQSRRKAAQEYLWTKPTVSNTNTTEIPAPQNKRQAKHDIAETRAHLGRNQAAINGLDVMIANIGSDVAVLRLELENRRNKRSEN